MSRFSKFFRSNTSNTNGGNFQSSDSDEQSSLSDVESVLMEPQLTKITQTIDITETDESLKLQPIETNSSLGSSVMLKQDQLAFSEKQQRSQLPILRFTPNQIQLIKQSWESSIAKLFASKQFWNDIYNNVYLIDHDIKDVLPPPEHQVTHFTGILRMIVMHCSNLEFTTDFLKTIGRKHGFIYGAKPEYFQVIGVAAFRSLHDKINMSYELEDVWIQMYCYMCNIMIEGCTTISLTDYESNVITYLTADDISLF